MLNIILTLVPVFGIMFMGAFAERTHLLPPQTAKCLNQFVYWFGLPAVLFSLMTEMRPQEFSWQMTLGIALGIMGTLWITTAIMRLMRYTATESALAGMLVSFPNGAYMGIPIIFMLLPQEVAVELAVGTLLVLSTLSLVYSEAILTLYHNPQAKLSATLKTAGLTLVKNPNMLAVFAGLLVGLSGITLPQSIMNIAKMLGSTASPGALFCMGMSFAAQVSAWGTGRPREHSQNYDDSELKWLCIILFAKLILMPLLIYGICKSLGVQGLSLAAATIIAAMPTGVATHVIAEKYGIFVERCVLAVIVGTFLSVFTLPLIMAFVTA